MSSARSPIADYFRALRQKRGLTQHDLAREARQSLVPVDRGFIAALETRGLPGTCAKLLSVMQLVEADPRILADLAVLGPEDDALLGELRWDEERDKVIGLNDEGRVGDALRHAARVLASARERDDRNDQSRALMALGIIAKNMQRPHAARQFAEEAIRCGALSRRDSAQAKILVAITNTNVGLPTIAIPILESIDATLRREDPLVDLEVLVALAVAYGRAGEPRRVVALGGALRRHKKSRRDRAGSLMRGFATVARHAAEEGDEALAADMLKEMRRLEYLCVDPDARYYALMAEAIYEKHCGSKTRALEILVELERLGRAERLNYAFFEARLHICDIALLTGDDVGGKRSLRELRDRRASVIPYPNDLPLYERLIALLES